MALGLDPQPTAAETCMVTRTPDGQFLLGRPHGDRRLVLGAGGSGHAFKHAPALGEAMAQLVCGETLFTDLSFLDPNRFLSAAASSPRASPLTS
ncbi:MAG: FAD-dependent oxidoreductase [Actinomycetes bacterium]